LIDKVNGFWRRIEEKTLDEVAERRGTKGYRKRQEEQHQGESDEYIKHIHHGAGMGRLRVVRMFIDEDEGPRIYGSLNSYLDSELQMVPGDHRRRWRYECSASV
jgi:hypothetical protein